MDAAGSVVDSLVIREGRVAFAGRRRDINPAPQEPTLDLGGRAVLPGLVDGHGHLMLLARARLELNLATAGSEDEIARMVAAAAARLGSGEWITGRGWDQTRWPGQRFPTRASLDRAAPGHPVALIRVDGHATWASGEALTRAGITRHSTDPQGGLIAKDRNGEPTGILIDLAQDIIRGLIPAPSEERFDQAVRATVAECLAIANARKPPDGPVLGAREQLAGLKQFIVEKKLVSIPSDEEALVDESPPFNRWNLAYIDIPGPYEKGLPSTYYISPPDPSWTAEEQAEYLPGEKDLLFISVHEVWPGHFLQFLHSNRSRSRFGQLFVGYAFAEGWAHYTEEMMWDAGLGDGDPTTHIGQLSNALLRNARYLSAIGLHTGSMTVAESEQLFLEKAFQDPGNARQQAARGTFDPAYLNYTLGKLMIRKLRDDWTASRGGPQAWRAFHDEFLSYGGPPIPLVRKAMLGAESGPAL